MEVNGDHNMKLTKQRLKQIIKEELVKEASYSSKEVKNIVWDMKEYVDKLVKVGEDFSIFQSAKSSAKALKQIQKLLKRVGQEIMMKKPLKEQLKRIGGMKLNEEIIEVERIQDIEASIFDIIIEFKKTFEKSEWKKNRKISSLIKKMIDLEAKLGNEISELG